MAGVTAAGAVRACVIAVTASMLVAACGGGGSSTPPPTELPESLVVSGPKQNALGASVTFASNASDPASALKYQWDFGDGTTGSQANPSHAYAKAGIYNVQLSVTNEVGATRTTTLTVYVSDVDVVKGRFCSAGAGAGWCWQKPLPQGNAILDYFFLNDLQGWAVGEAGTILSTQDGGVTWLPQSSGTDLSLLKVVFSDAQSGWIASTNGQMLRTVDGGVHWQGISAGQSSGVMRFGADSANSAWLLDYYGGGVKTTQDGGVHWSTVSVPNADIQAYVPTSGSDIWAMPWGYGTINLMHSVNAGASWAPIALPAQEPNLYRSLSWLQFSDALHGWVLGNDSGYSAASQTYVSQTLALRTADGGATWQPFSADIGYNNQVKFVDGSMGFASSPYSSTLLRSIDAGTTWQPLVLPDPIRNSSYPVYASFQAFSAKVLLLKDMSGRAYLSSDGGDHWAERGASGGASTSLNSVWFFDSREGLAIGSDGSSVRTTDGGQTWTTTAASSPGQGWRRAQFTSDGSLGWIISDSGAIYRSTDKGQSWLSPVPQSSASVPGAVDFHFIDAQNGWAVSSYGYYSGASIYRSVNGGSSWQAVDNTAGYYGLASIRFADAAHGVAVGPAGLALVTDDGGVTWSPRPTGTDRPLYRVTFVDSQTAVAVGEAGTILRSTDQGRSWRRLDSVTPYNLTDVRFVSARSGTAVGEFGVVLMTRDGGLTWTTQSAGHTMFRGVFFVDEQTGWVVGDNGSILATASGGH
jgi:photosystem II stability/assembly factor-like uncharacterized protein